MKPHEYREVVELVGEKLQTVVRRDQAVETENWELTRLVEELKDQLADQDREIEDQATQIEQLEHDNSILKDQVVDLTDQLEMRGLLESREYQEWEQEGRADQLDRELAEAHQTIDQLRVEAEIANSTLADHARIEEDLRRRLGCD